MTQDAYSVLAHLADAIKYLSVHAKTQQADDLSMAEVYLQNAKDLLDQAEVGEES